MLRRYGVGFDVFPVDCCERLLPLKDDDEFLSVLLVVDDEDEPFPFDPVEPDETIWLDC